MYFKVLLLCWLLFTPRQDHLERLIGTWAIDNQSHVEIFASGTDLSVKIIWLAEPLDRNGLPKSDKNNPDSKLRARQILGLKIAERLVNAHGVWKGRIYSPERGTYADCQLELIGDGIIKMTATKGLFTSTKTWKKI